MWHSGHLPKTTSTKLLSDIEISAKEGRYIYYTIID